MTEAEIAANYERIFRKRQESTDEEFMESFARALQNADVVLKRDVPGWDNAG